jgi:hypothetical protein
VNEKRKNSAPSSLDSDPLPAGLFVDVASGDVDITDSVITPGAGAPLKKKSFGL